MKAKIYVPVIRKEVVVVEVPEEAKEYYLFEHGDGSVDDYSDESEEAWLKTIEKAFDTVENADYSVLEYYGEDAIRVETVEE